MSRLPLEAAFYGILDSSYVPHEQWVEKYNALVTGGAGIIQLRAKGVPYDRQRLLIEQILEKRAESPSTNPPLIANADLDLALRYPGLGLHIRSGTLSLMEIREKLGPDRLLGTSAHSKAEAEALLNLPDGIIDYFSIGPIFASQTKPGNAPIGFELIRHLASKKPKLPFFCVGGINRGNISQIVAAGASRVVTISDVLLSSDTAAAVRETITSLRP